MSKMKKFLIVFFTTLLVLSLVSIVRTYLVDYYDEQQIKELKEIRNKATDIGEDAVASSPFIATTQTYKSVMLPEFQELYKKNSDLVGWLKIDGTRIDYPVMQNQHDAQYYLNHNFDKEKNKNGLPFLDEHSHIDGSDILLIYGHHMNSGMMFADLMKYKSESYYKEHTTFQFSTLYKKEEYEIVAVILSKVYRKNDDIFKYYQIAQVKSSADFDSYIKNIEKLALYNTGVNIKNGDKLLILSTCEYSTKDGRLAVIARKHK